MPLGVNNDAEVAQTGGRFFSCSETTCRAAAGSVGGGGRSHNVTVTTHLFLRPASPKSSPILRAGAPAVTQECRAGAGRPPRPCSAAPSSLLVWTRSGRHVRCPQATKVERTGRGAAKGPKRAMRGRSCAALCPPTPRKSLARGWGAVLT